jgi:hypothetical protein
MSAILFDLGDDKHDLMINNAHWRLTVDVFRTFGMLDAQRLQRLETAWLGERVTEEEAKAIGNALVAGPLSTVNWVGKVYPPSRFFRGARLDFRDYDKDTQWPSWLRALAEFCLTCKGFELC